MKSIEALGLIVSSIANEYKTDDLNPLDDPYADDIFRLQQEQNSEFYEYALYLAFRRCLLRNSIFHSFPP